MTYVPPYDILQRGIAISPDGQAVLMSRDLFRMLTATLAEAAGFDPAWYRSEYPDVADAITNGELGDELEHFTYCGYEEGRIPARPQVDEAWYGETYPDVAEALADGSIASAEEHYKLGGYRDGRAGTPIDEPAVLRWQQTIADSAELVRTLGGEAATNAELIAADDE